MQLDLHLTSQRQDWDILYFLVVYQIFLPCLCLQSVQLHVAKALTTLPPLRLFPQPEHVGGTRK